MTTTHPASTAPVAARMSTLDRWLPAWILLAMIAGLLLGRLIPGLGSALSAVQVDGVSLPIAIGLLVMMYPVLAKVGEQRWGRAAYETSFLPKVGPWALYGLLFTVVILFALQGEQITSRPLDVARIALSLLAYFTIMWAGGYLLGQLLGMTYERTTTLAFTAAGNYFELAIAIAMATFGITSGQALATVVGPLIEVPILVALVYVSLWLAKRFPQAAPAESARP